MRLECWCLFLLVPCLSGWLVCPRPGVPLYHLAVVLTYREGMASMGTSGQEEGGVCKLQRVMGRLGLEVLTSPRAL